MSAHDLRQLLDEVPDTRELILRRGDEDVLYNAWSDAHEEAEEAYREWRLEGVRRCYAAYRAAQDREDAAQDSLASGTQSLQVA